MRYFLTGATGFVGGELARQLRENGHEVVALVRSPNRSGQLGAIGCELAPGDVGDELSLRRAMAGADGVFHVAGWYRVGARDPSPGRTVNVEGTRRVLELMADLEIPRGVYTSTLAVNSDTGGRLVDESYRFEGEHVSEYDRTKWEAHHLIARPMMDRGLPLVTVMPGVIYGPGDHSQVGELINNVVRGRPIAVSASAAYCWSHVADVATAHILAMELGVPGEDYIIAGPPATLREALALAAAIAGRRSLRLVIPGPVLDTLARILTPLGRVARVVAAQAELVRAAGVTYLGDNAKARRELGYEPRSLEAGFADYIPTLLDQVAEE